MTRIGRASISVLAALELACSPAAPRPPTNDGKPPTDDEAACRALCDDEARCGDATTSGCLATCTRTASILKGGVVGRVTACRHETLAANCYGKDSAFTHGDLLSDARCFGQGAAPYAADASNRRNWAAASCDRMLRCQQTNPPPSARQLCIDASIAPAEEEDREAMRVVDALRDEVVQGWVQCLSKGACPLPGKPDEIEEACVLSALGKAKTP